MRDSQTNRQRLLLALGALAALSTAPNASALEFGRISLNSDLNQPLAAKVLLSSLTAGEKASLDVHVASPALFKRFGIERSSEVDNLDVTTAAGPQPGQIVVSISTRRPVREPFVDFLLEASTSSGSGLHEYTVLLNPEGAGHGVAQAMPSSARPQATLAGRSATQTRASAQPAAASSRSSADGSSFGPVREGDTLSGIAATLRAPGVTTPQMTVALFEANPQAFAGGMDHLIRGARLNVPTRSEARAISGDDIRAHLAQSGATAGQATDDADKRADNARNMVRASGESPPAALTEQPAAEVASVGTSNGGAEQSAFGQLSMPRTDQWPQELAPQASAGNDETDAAGASTAATAEAKVAEKTASSAGSERSDTASQDPADDRNTPPEDVTEGGDSGWLSPRNILLGLLLLVVIGAGLMARRRRQYKPVPMNFDGIDTDTDTDTDTDEETPGNHAAVPTTAESGPEAAGAPASDDRRPPSASTQASTQGSQLNPAFSSTGQAEPGQRPNHIGPATTASSGDTDDFVPAILRDRTAGEQSAARQSGGPDDPEPRGLEEDQASSRDEAAAASATDSNRAAESTTDDYAFEPQPVPTHPARQHDRGSDDEWAFDLNPASEGESTPPHGASVGTAADSDPDMIDPQAFNLDDSPESETAPDMALGSDTVAIRLDLANMYIEMEDRAMARGLLEEVIAEGDEAQKDKARSLLEQC